jgi:hypothetical protein
MKNKLPPIPKPITIAELLEADEESRLRDCSLTSQLRRSVKLQKREILVIDTLDGFPFDPNAIDLTTLDACLQHRFVPLSANHGLVVALADASPELCAAAAMALDVREVLPILAPPEAIERAARLAYKDTTSPLPERELSRPPDDVLAKIIEQTLAPLLDGLSQRGRASRRDAMRILFHEIIEGYLVDCGGPRCALCDNAPVQRRYVVVFASPTGGRPTFTLKYQWFDKEPAAVCEACVEADWPARDRDVAAVLRALRNREHELEAGHAVRELEKRFARSTIVTAPRARCSLCDEEGPVVRGKSISLGERCRAEMKRALE